MKSEEYKTKRDAWIDDWMKKRPGNVRRAPRAEQVRQWANAVIKATFEPLK